MSGIGGRLEEEETFDETCHQFHIRRFEEDFLKLGPGSDSLICQRESESDDDHLTCTVSSSAPLPSSSSSISSLADLVNEISVPLPPTVQEDSNLEGKLVKVKSNFLEEKILGHQRKERFPSFADQYFPSFLVTEGEYPCGDSLQMKPVKSFSAELQAQLTHLKWKNEELRNIITTIRESSSEAQSTITEINNGEFPEVDALKEHISELFVNVEREKESLKTKIESRYSEYLEFAVRTICENQYLKKEKTIALAAKDSELLTQEEKVRQQKLYIATVNDEIKTLINGAGSNVPEITDMSDTKCLLEKLRRQLEHQNRMMRERESCYHALQLRSNEYKEGMMELSKENAYLKKLLYSFGERMESLVASYALSNEDSED